MMVMGFAPVMVSNPFRSFVSMFPFGPFVQQEVDVHFRLGENSAALHVFLTYSHRLESQFLFTLLKVDFIKNKVEKLPIMGITQNWRLT